jgi:hypothetical protein
LFSYYLLQFSFCYIRIDCVVLLYTYKNFVYSGLESALICIYGHSKRTSRAVHIWFSCQTLPRLVSVFRHCFVLGMIDLNFVFTYYKKKKKKNWVFQFFLVTQKETKRKVELNEKRK